MKAIKQTLAVLMCVCLMLSLVAVSASAAGTCSIKIVDSATSNATVAGKTFHLFKIFDAESDGTNVTYKWIEKNGENLFEDFFQDPSRAGADATINDVVNWLNEFADYSSDLSQLTAALHDYVHPNANADPIVDYVSKEAGSGASSIVFDGLDLGYYMVYDATAITDGTPAIRAAAILTTPNETKEITLKADRPVIEKKVDNSNTGTPNWQLGTLSSVGDVETFKITTSIPDHTLYNSYRFNITDEMPAGLILEGDESTIAIAAEKDGTPVTLDSTMYTLRTTTNSDDTINGFAIEFLSVKEKWAVDTNITVTYKAKLTDTVVKAQDTSLANTTNGLVYPNKAILSYTNDPHEGTVGKAEAVATVYSLQLLLTKNAETADGTAEQKRLTGAEFEIYKLDENGAPVGEALYFTEVEATCQNGHTYTRYVYAPDDTDANATQTLKVVDECTNDDATKAAGTTYGGYTGQIKVTGLGAGAYGIKETKAPAGYRLAEEIFKLTLTNSIDTDGDVSEIVATYDSTSQKNGGRIYNVVAQHGNLKVAGHISNRAGSALPETGGIGTTLFTLMGVLLMAGALAFFTLRKRNSVA